MTLVRRLGRPELDTVIEWAAAEGWNPGHADADAFWAADPEGFVGAYLDDELVAAGSIVSYGGEFGFMGLFIVRPDHRGHGLGRRLWHWRRDHLLGRLRPGAAIGMDGVFEMQDFYAKGGFRFSHRNLRMRGRGQQAPADAAVLPLTDLPFAQVAEFDRAHFGSSREAFLRHWIDQPGALGLVGDGRLVAAGAARPCREGFKIGPLFADGDDPAERLFSALSSMADGQALFLDVPENNRGAVALAERHGMQEVFGCARMYLGDPPPTPWDRIYGVTTFELG